MLALAGGWAADARAHAMLDHAEPAVGATVNGAPEKVVLRFDSELEPALSTMKLEDAAGNDLTRGGLQSDPAQPSTLQVPLPHLVPGVYRVFWSVVARDGHRTTGDYSFTVR